jgi:GR25 family glycosyltransferase involved in LPS biosynthesis
MTTHQVHVINLDGGIARMMKFKEYNPYLDVIRVSAVDGTSVNKEELIEQGIITRDMCYAPGSLGCALSHLNLWKKSVAENRSITIFEDDVISLFRFRQATIEVFSQLPNDWDIIQWGYNINPLFVWLDLEISKAKLEFYDRRFSGANLLKFRALSFPSRPVRIAHSFGLMAYSVSPKGGRALLEYCLPLSDRLIPFPGTGVVIRETGIDCPMCGVYGSIQAFACMPPIVIHDDEQLSDRVTADGVQLC